MEKPRVSHILINNMETMTKSWHKYSLWNMAHGVFQDMVVV